MSAIALQAAIHAALVADAAVTSKVLPSRIVDGASDNLALPYIDLGEAEEYDWSTKTGDGAQVYLTLHVFTAPGGKKAAADIAGLVKTALRAAPLAVEGGALVTFRHRDTRTFREGDGSIHAALQFEALIQET